MNIYSECITTKVHANLFVHFRNVHLCVCSPRDTCLRVNRVPSPFPYVLNLFKGNFHVSNLH